MNNHLQPKAQLHYTSQLYLPTITIKQPPKQNLNTTQKTLTTIYHILKINKKYLKKIHKQLKHKKQNNQ